MAVPAEPEFSYRLWPPSEKTRALLVTRMADSLSSSSVLSVRYGRVDREEAAQHAKRIEEEAFVAAQKGQCESDSATVQMYAKQASRLMLEALKSSGKRETDFDISGGKRGFLTREQAEELLRPLTLTGNPFTKICLSNCSFGLEAGLVAKQILSSIKGNLVDVNLADIVAGRLEAEALEVMALFSEALAGSKLKSLNLSDNALGEKGVRAFSALLKSQTSLQALYFMNNGISEEAAQAICELLPSGEELRTLHFHNNMSGDGGALALAKLVEKAFVLEDFRFSSTRVATDGGVALCSALQAGKSLQRLDLRDNMFGPEGGIALASTLRLHPKLTDLYLSDLGLEDEGVSALADALADCAPELRVLDLGGNEMTIKSARSLACCIKKKLSLVTLRLAENELKDKGTLVVCEAITDGHSNLKELDLSSNMIGEVGAVAVAKCISGKATFTRLNLDGNRIPSAGVETTKEVLQKGVVGVKVLGSLDENDEENDDDDEEEEEEEEEEVGAAESNHCQSDEGTDDEKSASELKLKSLSLSD